MKWHLIELLLIALILLIVLVSPRAKSDERNTACNSLGIVCVPMYVAPKYGGCHD